MTATTGTAPWRPEAVPAIFSNIPHRFQPNPVGTKDDNGRPVYCIAPCYGYISEPQHLCDGPADPDQWTRAQMKEAA